MNNKNFNTITEPEDHFEVQDPQGDPEFATEREAILAGVAAVRANAAARKARVLAGQVVERDPWQFLKDVNEINSRVRKFREQQALKNPPKQGKKRKARKV